MQQLERSNDEKHRQREGPVDLAFLYVSAFRSRPKVMPGRVWGIPFWCQLVDLGFHVGALWILKGSPNRAFSFEIIINYPNMATRSGVRKNMKLWWKVDAKRRCLETMKKRFSLDTCRLLAGREIGWKKWSSKRFTISIQIEALGSIGSEAWYFGMF